MSVLLNILQALFGCCAALLGIAGKTWDETRPGGISRITLKGWGVITLAMATLCVTLIKEKVNHDASVKQQIENERQATENKKQLAVNMELQTRLLEVLEKLATDASSPADRIAAKQELVVELQQSPPVPAPPVVEAPTSAQTAGGHEPAWLSIARAEVGVKETGASPGNPRIIEYLEATSLSGIPLDENVPWSAAFVSWVFQKANIPNPKSAATLGWQKWGTVSSSPRPGDVVIVQWGMNRMHIGLFVADEGSSVTIIGGNVNNQVKYQSIPKANVLEYRRPPTGV